MDTNANTKPNFAQKIATGWKKHEREILIATTIASVATTALSVTGIAQHNAFLKEKGLYDEFYKLNAHAEV